MAFKVAARTVLELGAELISSDAVAVYELVKNAIDAGSKDGVTIQFCISLKHSDYVDYLARIDDAAYRRVKGAKPAEKAALSELKEGLINRILSDAPPKVRQDLMASWRAAGTLDQLRTALQDGYATHNWIEFRDSGHGMSHDDLLTAYLVIGTASRRRPLEIELNRSEGKAPFLGEKGVGRLSAMRLGDILRVETATASDTHMNVLDVDWSEFHDLDKLIEDIKIAPKKGGRKPDGFSSGMRITIRGLHASWSQVRVRHIASSDLSRFSDPFTKAKKRFRILILFNGERIDVPRLDSAILDLAHARVEGKYELRDGEPHLRVAMWCGDLGKGNAPEQRLIPLERLDVLSITGDRGKEIASSALTSVGPFSFDLYWFNRRLLKAVDSIGERKRVLELQAQWSGIMMFRDGYRVFPYGETDDDWLDLDRRALASPGYKLNKAQFIGRVAISRTANRRLIDQTNRQGLKDCDEKQVLVEVLRFVIQNRLKSFIEEVEDKNADVVIDFEKTERLVKGLNKQVQSALRELEKRHADEKPKLRELMKLFDEMHDYFMSAKQKADQIADERDRMIQLAGVGLLLEIVAHELARSTSSTLRILDEANAARLPGDVAQVFGTLRDEMQTMSRRLRVLDPLSVSGRQRKETFDFAALIKEVFDGHKSQFRRHGIRADVKVIAKGGKVSVHGVRGMFVQIIENLIQNSVYWLDLKRSEEPDFAPSIEVRIGELPHVMEYSDNGPGIPEALREEVFKAFYSTKGASRRQGLGLYIARDCAQHHEGQLYLSGERQVQAGRLNTFVLELPVGGK